MKKYKLRFPSEDEKKFMINLFEKFMAEFNSKLSFYDERHKYYNELQKLYAMNVKIDNDADNGRSLHITKKEFNEWVKKNEIIIPEFKEGEYII